MICEIHCYTTWRKNIKTCKKTEKNSFKQWSRENFQRIPVLNGKRTQ